MIKYICPYFTQSDFYFRFCELKLKPQYDKIISVDIYTNNGVLDIRPSSKPEERNDKNRKKSRIREYWITSLFVLVG